MLIECKCKNRVQTDSSAYCPYCGRPLRQPCPYCQTADHDFAEWVLLDDRRHDTPTCRKPLKRCSRCGQLYAISSMRCGLPGCNDERLENLFYGQRAISGDADNSNAIDFTSYDPVGDSAVNENLVPLPLQGADEIIYGSLSAFGLLLLVNQKGIDIYNFDPRTSTVQFANRLPLSQMNHYQSGQHMEELLSGLAIGLDGCLVVMEPDRVWSGFLPGLAGGDQLQRIDVTGLQTCLPIGNQLVLLTHSQREGARVVNWRNGSFGDLNWSSPNIQPFDWMHQNMPGLRPFADYNSLYFFDKNRFLHRIAADGSTGPKDSEVWSNTGMLDVWFAAARGGRVLLVHNKGYISLEGGRQVPKDYPGRFEPTDNRRTLPAVGNKHLLVPGRVPGSKQGMVLIVNLPNHIPILQSLIQFPDNVQVEDLKVIDYSAQQLALVRFKKNLSFYNVHDLSKSPKKPTNNPMTQSNRMLHMVGHDGSVVFIESVVEGSTCKGIQLHYRPE